MSKIKEELEKILSENRELTAQICSKHEDRFAGLRKWMIITFLSVLLTLFGIIITYVYGMGRMQEQIENKVDKMDLINWEIKAKWMMDSSNKIITNEIWKRNPRNIDSQMYHFGVLIQKQAQENLEMEKKFEKLQDDFIDFIIKVRSGKSISTILKKYKLES